MTTLPPEALFAPCDPATLPFQTTAEIEPREEFVGQARALRALGLGLSLRADGYNLFIVGAPRTGKRSILRRLVAARAAAEPTPPDLCYVHNFDDPDRPIPLELPAGRGRIVRGEFERLLNEYARRLPLTFEGEAFSRRAAAIAERATRARNEFIASVEAQAKQAGFRLDAGDGALDVVAANPDGSAMSEQDYDALPAAARADIEERGQALRAALDPQAVGLLELERTAAAERDRLVEETAQGVAHAVVDEARARIAEAETPSLARHLSAIERDLVLNAQSFLPEETSDDEASEEEEAGPAFARRARPEAGQEAMAARYALVLLVDRAGENGAPVVEEPNPTHANLFGRIDRQARLGALETSVAGLKAGALHRARGGYLILDAAAVVEDDAIWATLKRALRSGQVRIEDEGGDRMIAGSLQPEPLPLDTKVLLVGAPELYLLLFEADEGFADLFKVKVEFDDSLARTPEHELALARFIAAAARELAVPPLRAAAVACLIEHASRQASHQRRLSAQLGHLRDLVAEAGHAAQAAGRAEVVPDDVECAIDDREERGRLLELTLRRMVDEGTLVVRTQGAGVGAVNGLAVIAVGDHAFGQVLRVTARAHPGRPGILDIEREVGLGGPSHSKGVLLLGGYLAGRYARERPLALRATLAAEQSHGPIEGDSASLAELCALLSAVGNVPLRQDLAVTGAVSQLGEVLAVGDVTTKIEGFFDLCNRRGLTGSQGVIIPLATASQLMLGRAVLDAVRRGQFHVDAVETVDEAMALLSGQAGVADAAVEATLARWATHAAAR